MSLRDAATFDVQTHALGETDVVELAMDEEAFRGFYDRTARMLSGYLLRLTGSHATADDLLQETYYRFLRAGASLENETHRRRYLYRIATNLARDRFRRIRVRPVTAPAEAAEHAAAPAGADDQAAVERRLDLSKAMDQLRPRDRAMLWLAYAQGATHREIADVVGVGTASVKPLLFRARKRLSALLGRGDGPR
jgi:RNA polymerase sigma-70 factor (ECF subfamily)